MSQPLLETVARVVEHSQTLPARLEEWVAGCRATRELFEKLRVSGEAVKTAVASSASELESELARVRTELAGKKERADGTSQQLENAFRGLHDTTQATTIQTTAALAEVLRKGEQVDRQMADCREDLRAAAERHSRLTSEGLQAVENAWARLETTLRESEAALQSLTAATHDAWSAERTEIADLAEHLQQTRALLDRSCEQLLSGGQRSREAFQTRMAGEVLGQAVVANADRTDAATREKLESGVRQPGQKRIQQFNEEAVQSMGQQARAADELVLPPRHRLEGQVKRYADGIRPRPMFLRVQAYYEQLGLEMPFAHLLTLR